MLRLALALGLAQAGFHAFIASLPLALLAAGNSNGEIGALMGLAAVVNIAAALAAGGLIDRYGGRRLFLVGTGSFALAAALMATGIAAPGDTWALVLVRVLQGAGLAAILPSALSLVPGLVEARQLPTALAFVGVAANVSLAAVPPISLLVLDRVSLEAVAALTLVSVVAAAAMLWPLREAERQAQAVTPGDRPRTFRPAWRPAWAAPLVIALLFVVHWGVVTGYLPQRAASAGADVGLFFTGDALALLALRVPAGYLAGRVGSLPLLLAGIVVTGASLTLLLPPATTPLLLAAGIGTGAGGALLLPTLMLELSHRSDPTNRGSAFALFTVVFSIGIAIGSIGIAPVFGLLGFELAMGAGIVAVLATAIIALRDPDLRRPHSATAAPTTA
ncbi:hypothetical protein BH20CHL6_BH20CHL6_12470 [soil metagenome]